MGYYLKPELKRQIQELEKADWDLYTITGFISLFKKQSDYVRKEILDALMEIAKRKAKPVSISPIDLLTELMFYLTVSSGGVPEIFQFLVQLGTPETEQAVRKILRGNARNKYFEEFLEILQKGNRVDLIKELEKEKLSRPKIQILKAALTKED